MNVGEVKELLLNMNDWASWEWRELNKTFQLTDNLFVRKIEEVHGSEGDYSKETFMVFAVLNRKDKAVKYYQQTGHYQSYEYDSDEWEYGQFLEVEPVQVMKTEYHAV